MRTVRFLLPAASFALALVVLQLLAGTPDWRLPLASFAVFLVSTAMFRALPWARLARRVSARSRLYVPALFLLFTRHFALTLAEEARRVLLAHSLSTPRRFTRAWFESLAWAVAAIFRRALNRAERFHAAQSIAGLLE